MESGEVGEGRASFGESTEVPGSEEVRGWVGVVGSGQEGGEGRGSAAVDCSLWSGRLVNAWFHSFEGVIVDTFEAKELISRADVVLFSHFSLPMLYSALDSGNV
ncbi:hypothetical protein MLD38_038062 [Melastoma candidum]|uniref:Uncharacterized protein n=1 Tax=Melastoma candidum TaxID=119954 RepID=A0ACB9L011_9MYRT|nr:hypothetical protein MLD38_038062 [Melastoma candidum]